jgi:hypothetical protein
MRCAITKRNRTDGASRGSENASSYRTLDFHAPYWHDP